MAHDADPLDQDLDERISKARRRGRGESERDRALAEAILLRIDRKAARPSTDSELRKGISRRRQLLAKGLVLTSDERQIASSPREILLIYSSQGRLLRAVLGDARSVRLPADIPAFAILSHNHPSGRGPSASDIKAVLSRPGVRLRIISPIPEGGIEVFELLQREPLEAEKVDRAVALYQEAAESGGDGIEARRLALALLSTQMGGSFQASSNLVR